MGTRNARKERMNREEAIYRLKNAAWLGTNKDREEIEQAVDMAVEALCEYEKMKDLCEQYRYERDVLEEKQRNRDEVVHCRDCKRRDTMICPIWHQKLSDDDCCSYGERREE